MKHRMSDLVTAAFLLDHGHMVVYSDFGHHNHHHHYNHFYPHKQQNNQPSTQFITDFQARTRQNDRSVACWKVISKNPKPSRVSYHPWRLGANCCSQGAWAAGILLSWSWGGCFEKRVSGKVMYGGHVSYEINTFIVRWSISKYHWMHELGLLARFSGRDTIRSK